MIKKLNNDENFRLSSFVFKLIGGVCMKRSVIVFTIGIVFIASFMIANQVTITFWEGMGGPLGKTLQTITSLFNKDNPNINVELIFVGNGEQLDSKILAAAEAKDLPTMAQAYPAWTAQLVYDGVVAPLESFPGFSEVENQLYPAEVNLGRINGKVYALPFNQEIYVLYYRPNMLAEAGINPPKTMEELQEDAKLLTIKQNGKTVRYGFAFRTNVMALTSVALQFGGGTYVTQDGKITINSTGNVKALSFLVNLVKDGYAYATPEYPDHELTTSSVALLLGGGAWLPYDISDIAGQRDGLKMVPVPYGPNKETTPALKGEDIIIFNTASSEQQAAAWKYIQFLLSPTVQLYWTMQTDYSPINKAVTGLDEWKLYVESSPYHPAPIGQGMQNAISETELLPWWPAVQLDIKTAVENAVSGIMTPQQALDWAQQVAENIYQRYYLK
ncbi:MAG: ABC transporter substrate-binding protein [Candidatus Nanoarchaeia archaeon]|nr:ABC transporter substrate-binding protein [Candidatus Jingweiarchaeum tengchongense]